MFTHWINELMNLLAGNSRYKQYSPRKQVYFILGLLLFLILTVGVIYLA